MAIKRFKSFVAEDFSADDLAAKTTATKKDEIKPKAKGEEEFANAHKVEKIPHPVAKDHQFQGSHEEIMEASVKEEDDCECEDGDDDCECPEDDDEESELSEGKVVDQLTAISKGKAAKKVKFGNGKSEEIDTTTASALLNMLRKLKPANKAKAEKMLEKSPEGMFQLLDVAFGGK